MLLQQAKRMKKDSDARFPVPEIDVTVWVPILDVDRAKVGTRSVLAYILGKTGDGFYALGTKNERLP